MGLEERRVLRTAASFAADEDLYNLGSGYLVADRLVLTAAHVLEPAEGVLPQEGQAAEVARIGGEWQRATVAWLDVPRDVAVLACPGLRADGMVRWGRLAGSAPLDWGAVGFPVASVDREKGRQPEHTFGRTSPISDSGAGRLVLTVESRRSIVGDSPWACLSGAAVFCSDYLVGVVITDPGTYARSLLARRVEDFCRDPRLAQLLGSLPMLEDVEDSAVELGELVLAAERNVPSGHVFISYVRENSRDVDWLQRILESAGIRVWRDTADLWPGEDWRAKIRDAISNDALVFIACFSHRSVSRKVSYQNEELVLAIEQLRLRRPDKPWLIPVRFDDCQIPELDIGGGRTLTSIQRLDLFGPRASRGAKRLVGAVLRILGLEPNRVGDQPRLEPGRSPIDQAMGILMHALGCDAENALERIEREAQRRNIEASDVAAEILQAYHTSLVR